MADAVYIATIVSLVFFYGLIIAVGVVSSIWFRRKHKLKSNDFDLQIIANRKLGCFVGWMTMSATLVGGGFLNGTAESIAQDGLVWTLAPFGIALGLPLGGLLFAPAMRRRCYKTMLDPLEEKYGADVTSIIYLASLFGDVLWSAAILAALGTTISVIVGLSTFISVIVSAVVAVFYTLIGQMVSVAYTDIAELFLMVVGLAVVTPFAMTNEAIAPKLAQAFSGNQSAPWLGTINPRMAGFWADLAVAMTLGTIPWQSYFQRVLSVETINGARIFSILSGFSALMFAIPPICLGVVGSIADWNSTGVPVEVYSRKSLTLPLVIQQFTPAPASILGLGAISAAVMSSVDSAILASASMFTNHTYRRLRQLCICFKKSTSSDADPSKPSNAELSIVLKLSIILIGVLATVVALLTPSLTIYGLFILAADIVFVATLPQLICALYIQRCNSYGGLLGFVFSLLLRFGAGEPLIHLPTVIEFPYYSPEQDMQLFPFRSLTMACSVLLTVVISVIAQSILPRVNHKWDLLRCVHAYWLAKKKPAVFDDVSVPLANSTSDSTKL